MTDRIERGHPDYVKRAYVGKAVDIEWPGGDGRGRGPLAVRYTRAANTPEQRAKWEAKRNEAIARIPAELVRLDALTGIEREVLDLHARDDYGDCQGCDGGPEYSGTWPCRTVDLIADRQGINLDGFWWWQAQQRRKEPR